MHPQKTIYFMVQGSSPDPYKITFVQRDGSNFSAFCTCAAGINGQYCKHRLNILDGKLEGIISQNAEQVNEVASWLPDSDVEAALKELRRLELELEIAKKSVIKAKKELAKTLQKQ